MLSLKRSKLIFVTLEKLSITYRTVSFTRFKLNLSIIMRLNERSKMVVHETTCIKKRVIFVACVLVLIAVIIQMFDNTDAIENEIYSSIRRFM